MWQTNLGRCIYQSDYGHQVWQNFFYRWLTFSSTPIQSVINRHRPEKPVTACVRTLCYAARQHPGKVLHLGLGGACVPHALSPWRENNEWTFVELDAIVIDLAKRYFFLDRLQPFTLIRDDAAHFVQTADKTYPHIIIDMADAYSFPQSCANFDFFKQCASLLQDKGVITLNLPDPQQHKIILEMIHEILPGCVTLRIPGMINIIILAGKFPDTQSLIRYLKLAEQSKILKWDPEWGMLGELKSL